MKRRRRPTQQDLRNVLRSMSSRTQLVSFEEGEKYVCAVCNLPVKFCQAHPTGVCASLLQEGTQLRLLRRIARAIERGEYGACVVCGKVFTRQERVRNPLREVCHSCQTSTPARRRPSRRKE